MIKGLLDKLSSMTLPDTAIRSMYDIIAAGQGGTTIIRLKNGAFSHRDENGSYILIDDIFSFVVGRVPNAPSFVVRKAKEMMSGESSNVLAAANAFCSGGDTAFVQMSDGCENEGKPSIRVIVLDSWGTTKSIFEDEQVFAFFKQMIGNHKVAD